MTVVCYYCDLMDAKKYTIDDLCELTGYSRRTIRYYIQEGLLEPPAGRGRGGYYYDSHLAQLVQIRSLQEMGMSLVSITEFLKAGKRTETSYSRDVWAKYEIAPGVEINVRRDLEEIAGKKVLEIVKIAKSILKEEISSE